MLQPGISGNTHGRPRGSVSGRVQVLAALDRRTPSVTLPVPSVQSVPSVPPPSQPTPGKESPSSCTIAHCPLPIAPVSQPPKRSFDRASQ